MLPRLKKLLRIAFISANVVVILFYLLACLVPFINSGRSWFIAMLGLVFPLLLVMIIGFLIYWIFRHSKWAWVCLAALLLSWKQVSVMFSFHFPKKFNEAKSSQTLRVLTWNLSSWGESNRSDGKKTDYEEEMTEVIKKSNADILCLQEYVYLKDKKVRDTISPALKESGYKYSYFVQTNYTYRIYQTTVITGVAIISKYPIVDTAHFFYDYDDYAEPIIYADIKVNDRTVRIFSTHLQSVMFDNYHYQILHNLKDPRKASITESKAIAYRLRNAYIKRAGQAELLNKKVKESPYPVIICGDFNDVPNSYSYFTAKGGLQDAFLKKGSGFGKTLRIISPTLRIDYILADKKFDVTQYKKTEVPYSDHYPILADLEFSKD
ncbi:MAG: endonuclease/exonuclease/phosphatase family protein [Chitinophagaceae bacterium]|nr:endonuclease/exonuclease/phosphatase family protein [Chitinophagaceae bacterium]